MTPRTPFPSAAVAAILLATAAASAQTPAPTTPPEPSAPPAPPAAAPSAPATPPVAAPTPPSSPPGPAAPVDTKERAKQHFRTGMAAFTLEHYDEAIREFEAGFMLQPDPVFLYNLGQSYRLSKRPDQAVVFYQKYLKMMPAAPNRADVEEHIAALKKQIAERPPEPTPPTETTTPPTATTTPPTPPPPVETPKPPPQVEAPKPPAVAPAPLPPPAPPEKPRRWPIWVGVAAGVVVVGAAVGLGVALSRPSEPYSLENAR